MALHKSISRIPSALCNKWTSGRVSSNGRIPVSDRTIYRLLNTIRFFTTIGKVSNQLVFHLLTRDFLFYLTHLPTLNTTKRTELLHPKGWIFNSYEMLYVTTLWTKDSDQELVRFQTCNCRFIATREVWGECVHYLTLRTACTPQTSILHTIWRGRGEFANLEYTPNTSLHSQRTLHTKF